MGVKVKEDILQTHESDRVIVPIIVQRHLVVDGIRFTEELLSDEEAVVAVVLAHSVFNLTFERKVAPLYTYVQRYTLNIDDGLKPPQKCLKFVQQLK